VTLHVAQDDTATEAVPVSRAEHKIVFILSHEVTQNRHFRADGVHTLFDVRGAGTNERSRPKRCSVAPVKIGGQKWRA